MYLRILLLNLGCIVVSSASELGICNNPETAYNKYTYPSDKDSSWSDPKVNAMSESRERTFIMVKPDGVQRGLVGKVIKRFEEKGFKLIGMKFTWASKELLERHYAEHVERPFFRKLVDYMSSGPVVPMIWEGLNVVKTGRDMLGATDPKNSAPGTIRGDYGIIMGRNIAHGSDSVDSATREINLWFREEEQVSWTQANEQWIYE